VQIAHLAASPRSGDVILSAARDWDFRAKYEPIPHVSSHGALHREHMLVPLLLNRPPSLTPRRTVDVMPSALAALGIATPKTLDGVSFY
jgi:arylsulfatase A-like enzyme